MRGRSSYIVHFGDFEADLRSKELRKHGISVKLQRKPFEILALLLERGNDIVTRDELCKRLWPGETYVVFDDNLNTAVKKLRNALGDSARAPHFVETLPGLGYRFVAPIRHRPSDRIPVILVLPFDNLSGDPGEDYFVDGVTDALIHDLGLVPSLHVISRTSSMVFKQTRKPIRDIARDVGADAVVEGSVVRVDDKVRVTARLIDAVRDEPLLSRQYHRDFCDVLDVQSEIALAIVKGIRVELDASIQENLARTRRVQPEAYEAYLRGVFFWNEWTPVGWRKALSEFQRSVELDPDHAIAHARLAAAYNLLGSFGVLAPEIAHPAARAAAQSALGLEERQVLALAVLGATKAIYEWNWEQAEREIGRAVKLGPSVSDSRYAYSVILARRGKGHAAIHEMETVVDLDPLSLRARSGLGLVLYLGREYTQAVDECREVLSLDPDFPYAHWILGMALLALGEANEALRVAKRAVELAPNNEHVEASLGLAFASAGGSAEARRLVTAMTERRAKRYVPPSAVAKVHAGLGELQEAIDWLREACAGRDSGLAQLRDPSWDAMREIPEFQDLLVKVRLDDAQIES